MKNVVKAFLVWAGFRCKFWKHCEWYEKGNVTCERDGGLYYGMPARPAGCYVRNEGGGG